jgi:hypothetical protein
MCGLAVINEMSCCYMISCTYCENADVKGILKLKSNEGGLEKDFETGLLIC